MRRDGKKRGWAKPAVALGALAVVALVVVLAVSAARAPEAPPTEESAKHPEFAQGTACSSCKAELHDYRHEKPYLGECTTCHGLDSWTAITFAHTDTAFDLGFHANVGCAFCHTKKNPEPDPDCGSCHQSEHPKAAGCSKCHQVTAWRMVRPLPLEHVSLVNGHATLKCFDCHVGVAAFAKSKACVDCHGTHHGGLTACGDCHDPRLNWKPKKNFDHAAFFPLVGRHATLQCTECHPTGNFAAANPACVSCHGVRHGGLTACASCHTPAGFKPSTFKHSSVFALTGRHAKLACTSCHPKLAYAKAIGDPKSCSSCHGVKHGGLTACGSCHTTAGFIPSTFRHSSVWPLVGKHGSLACSQCHPQRLFAKHIGNKNSCSSCHGTQHGGLTACGSCHTPAGFKPSTFKHSSVWALTGKHATLACTSCHPNNQYAVHKSRSACTNCHGVFHGDQTRCEDCHTTAGFDQPKAITHPAPIVLGAKHASMSCRLCHPTVVFSAPTKPCEDCHTAPHVAPTDCMRCHQPTVWADTHFVHDSIAYHIGIPYEDACVYCHTTGNYSVYTCDRCHF